MGYLSFTGSSGAGVPARVPWVRLGATQAEGITAGYLFSNDAERIYLNIGLGTGGTDSRPTIKQMNDLAGVATHIAEKLKPLIDDFDFGEQKLVFGKIDLHSEGKARARAYEETNVVAIEYDTQALPSHETLVTNLQSFITLYEKALTIEPDQRNYGDRPYWFLKHQTEDTQTLEQYLEKGTFNTLNIFEAHVHEMESGDKVALAKQTRVNEIPGYQISDASQGIAMMTIYATGTYRGRDRDDSSNIMIDWEPLEAPRDWYVFTKTDRIWKIERFDENWKSENLIDFTFFGDDQVALSQFAPKTIWKNDEPRPANLEYPELHYFTFGGNEDVRKWEHAHDYGFLSAGMGIRYSKGMDKLASGDYVLAHVPRSGYVGFGQVVEEKTPAVDFSFDFNGEDVPFIEAFPGALDYLENTEDPDLFEYVVGIEWLDAVSLEQAIWEIGMFANQNTVVTLNPENLRHANTIHALSKHFPELANLVQSGLFKLITGNNPAEIEQEPLPHYSIADIVSDGCFIPEMTLNKYLDRLKTKKNIILQGPPGTGKTWLAKKLGFALIGSIDQRLMTRVQFHPNLSYEDFIRGWRPVGDGKLDLADGPLMDAINAAIHQPDSPHVVVIEEINRGNPAQIFGEMLTLLESDKRSKSEALKLSYSRDASETVYVPDNLYLIGTMNIADRSLALVDLALRRRFAFLDLVPQFNPAWSKWAKEHGSLTTEFVNDIRSRINALNGHITESPALGAQFVVGHSYLTPHENTPIPDANEWFRQIVTTEISPLLEEYWFDRPEKANEETQLLLEGI